MPTTANARLITILAVLAASAPPIASILDLGCGNGDELQALCGVFPDSTILGLDRQLLRWNSHFHCRVLVCQSDVTALPFAHRFDLVLIRHPDVHNSPGWQGLFAAIEQILGSTSRLLITCYSGQEAILIRDWLTGHPELKSEPVLETSLAPVNLTGQDRFILNYRAVTPSQSSSNT